MRNANPVGQPRLPIQPVENPIINRPYEEPNRYYTYHRETGEARLVEGQRRPAAYYYKDPEDTRRGQLALELEEKSRELTHVNHLRADVKRWRESNYEGASNITKDLLRHWWNPDRPRRFFFCQLEAVETVIFLNEIRGENRDGTRRRPRWNPAFTDDDFGGLYDLPDLPDGKLLTRFGCKMATGSGKTVVMAMLISWAFCNRGRVPSAEQFPNAALVVCPNLTIKERLQVLRIDGPEGGYYREFDIVPARYAELLHSGKVLVTNWHNFAPESEHSDGGKTAAVIEKGPEGGEAFARRILGDLHDRAPIMVLNDEGHHAYRPAPLKDKLTGQEAREAEEQNKEATIWIQGIDRINAACGVSLCVDLSATPFYIKGSGYPEGEPFPWLVSDFSLVDAIESGITKIPRLPVSDTTGRPEARYFRLWRNVTQDLLPAQKLSNGKPKPEVVWEKAQDALVTLANDYQKKFEANRNANENRLKAPPVMIVVCDNTDIADVFFRNISGEIEVDAITDEEDEEAEDATEEEAEPESKKKPVKPKKVTEYTQGKVFPELLQNAKNVRRTLRIDSDLLKKIESEDPSVSKNQAIQAHRAIINSVGKVGEPGAQVRCVVSVAMLTEGWDANNVTHILGLRAFGSQLLCEQVVGRGLRRMNYTPDPETGMLPPEYVDVYGIPFSVIPYKGKSSNPPPDPPPPNHVYAMKERAKYEIRFPNVEGYVYALNKNLIKADIEGMARLSIEPDKRPTAVFMRPTSGYSEGTLASLGAVEFAEHDREEYYKTTHLQAIEFEIARQVVWKLVGDAHNAPSGGNGRLRGIARHQLFPQVLRFVHAYVARKIDFRGAHPCELGLDVYVNRIVSRLLDTIEPDETQGEPPQVPILNRYKPIGTTADVNFMTTRPTHGTQRSHVNQIVLDSSWEKSAAFYLEQLAGDPESGKPVFCYVRNERPFLVIPYEYEGVSHSYEPDYLVRLNNGLTLILEIKGAKDDKVAAKSEAARRWVRAVNNSDKLGKWDYRVCEDVQTLGLLLTHLNKGSRRTAD